MHEVVWQVPHIPHTTHDVVALHVMRWFHKTWILSKSILLPRYIAEIVTHFVDVIDESILSPQEARYQIELGVFKVIVSHENGFVRHC